MSVSAGTTTIAGTGVIKPYSVSSSSATVAFKRGSHAVVELYFIGGDVPPENIILGMKRSGVYDSPAALIVEGSEPTALDDGTGRYFSDFTFDLLGGEIDAALNADGDATNDKSSAAMNLEISWEENGSTFKSTTLAVTIYNDVIRVGDSVVPSGMISAGAVVLCRCTWAEYQALTTKPKGVYYVIEDAPLNYVTRDELEDAVNGANAVVNLEETAASLEESRQTILAAQSAAAQSAQNAEASAQTAVEAQEIVQTMTDSLTNLRSEGLFVVKSGLTAETFNNQANGMIARFCTARELISADSALAADLEARHVAAVVPESLGIFRRSGSATNSARFVRISCWDSSAGTWKVVFRSVNSIVPNSDSSIDGEAHTLWELEFVGGNSHARSLGLDEPVIVSFATSRTAGDRAMTGIDCKAIDGATGTNSVTYIDFSNETAPFTTAANYAPALRIGFKFAGTASMNDLTDMLTALEARVAALEEL